MSQSEGKVSFDKKYGDMAEKEHSPWGITYLADGW